MHTSLRRRLVPVLALAALTAGSVPIPLASAADGESTLVVGWSQETTHCDGSTLVVFGGGMMACPDFNQETLLKYDLATDTVQPWLASSWEETPDSVTFHLREGVTFQDGTPFDADAVVYNFRRAFDPTFPANQRVTIPYTTYFPNYRDVVKVDDATVTVHFDPTPNPLRAFTTFATLMQSPTAVEAMGDAYQFDPVGTGPYRVVAFEPNVRWELERYPDYWGEAPQPDRIIAVVKTDTASLVNDLRAGTIDAMISPPSSQHEDLRGSGMVVQTWPTLEPNYMALNVTMPPFDDVLVRRAANYALDKEAIVQVLNGQGEAMYAAWFPGLYAYNGDVVEYRYDPEQAGQLLDEAGWTLAPGSTVRQKDGQPLHVSLVMRQGQAGALGAQPIVAVSNLQAVGFEVDLQVRDAASYNDPNIGVFSPTCCNMSNAGHASLFADPIAWLTRWTTASIPPTERNFAFWSNADYDQLVAQATVEVDAERRVEQLKEAQAILREEAPILFAVRAMSSSAWNPDRVASLPMTMAFSKVDPWSIELK